MKEEKEINDSNEVKRKTNTVAKLNQYYFSVTVTYISLQKNNKQMNIKIKKENKELKNALDKATDVRTILTDINQNLNKIGELENGIEKEVFKADSEYNIYTQSMFNRC